MSADPAGSAARARVVLFHRKPTPHVFSIEQVFELVRERLPDEFDASTAVSTYPGQGLVGRVRGMFEARRRQGDVNHVVGDWNFLVLLLDPARTVLTIHDCEFMDRGGPVKRWIYKWLWLRLPARRSRIVTVPSEAVRADLERFVTLPPDKVRVIPNPVAPVFTPSNRPFRRDEPVILQVGTRPNKNLERVAHALNGTSCRLEVVGPLTAEQRRLLTALGIRYEEFVDLTQGEVAGRYRNADLVVFASVAEGFGMPVVEAQASGRPVVTSTVPPLPEVAGDGACFVDPFDVASIGAGIRRVVEDEAYRADLRANGLRNVSRFDPGAIAERYCAVYDEVLGAGHELTRGAR